MTHTFTQSIVCVYMTKKNELKKMVQPNGGTIVFESQTFPIWPLFFFILYLYSKKMISCRFDFIFFLLFVFYNHFRSSSCWRWYWWWSSIYKKAKKSHRIQIRLCFCRFLLINEFYIRFQTNHMKWNVC